MGQVAFRTYAPVITVCYIIPKSMSQWDPYCEQVQIKED